jgi:hypothetical protein
MATVAPEIEAAPVADTLRLEVGSPEVDGRILPEHRARNRVYIGDAATPSTSWTNELVLGDSAGIPVMRWITKGEQGDGASWELLQTYHARTLAPLAYSRTSSAGVYLRYTVDGTRVRGVRRTSADAPEEPFERDLARMGFFSGASDLIPMAVGYEPGLVMTAPVWGPNMEAAQDRVFTVVREEQVEVEGAQVMAWRVDEHIEDTGALYATWWLSETEPYMVLGEIMLPNGQMQRITGVALTPPGARRQGPSARPAVPAGLPRGAPRTRTSRRPRRTR